MIEKDGKGNIIIDEKSFEELVLNYNEVNLEYYHKILYQKYSFYTEEDGYFLVKKYEHQKDTIEWSVDDVDKVRELFKDTLIIREPINLEELTPIVDSDQIKYGSEPLGIDKNGWMICEPEPEPWLIERSLRTDFMCLTISEDGKKNRPWKEHEIKMIEESFNHTREKKLNRIL